MARNLVMAATLILWSLTASPAAASTRANDTLGEIERLASLAETAEPALVESIVAGIEQEPSPIATALMARLKEWTLTDNQVSTFVWALGVTGDRSAVGPIEEIHRRSPSELVRANCLQALAQIGGTSSERILLSALDAATDGEMKFTILNHLARMHSASLLPRSEGILRLDPENYYWQSVLVFGTLGDGAVPFLLAKIGDSNRNVRANAVNVLGQWLIPPETAKPLLERYWVEEDEEIRGIVLRSLERTIPDLGQMEATFRQIVAREKNDKLLAFAYETLAGMDSLKSGVAAYAGRKRISAARFGNAYGQLQASLGREGSYRELAESSSMGDEPVLKALRERILWRESDEALEDYQKINDIIMRNRMAGK